MEVQAPKGRIIDVRRVDADLQEIIDAGRPYDLAGVGLADTYERAVEARERLERGEPGSGVAGAKVVREWQRLQRIVKASAAMLHREAMRLYCEGRQRGEKHAEAARAAAHAVPLSRSRSREQSHAPRTTTRASSSSTTSSADPGSDGPCDHARSRSRRGWAR